MRSNCKQWIALLAIFCIVGGTVAADIKAEMSFQQRLAHIQSINGRFTQKSFDIDGVEIDTSEGSFSVAKTAKILWQVESPMAQQIVSNGSLLWIYDPDLEQVVIETVSDKLELTPLGLFNQNSDQIEARYSVSERHTDAGTIEYHLSARDQSALFKTMVISFVDEAPIFISLVDSFGQTTDIAFEGVDLNLTLEDSVFEFSIPDGIDVIRNDR